MIVLYSGTPGSGKSLHTARTILNRLRWKEPCICNFDIDMTKIKCGGDFVFLQNYEITPDYLREYSRSYFKGKKIKEDEILLVLDECQLMFNARDWNQKGRNEWLSFFTQHRKYGYTIILVAQFDRMIDRQIRSLIEYEFIHRKVSNYGWKGWLLSFWSLGKLFVAVKVWYPMKEKVGSEFFMSRKKFYSLYDTYNSFGTDGGGDLGDSPTAGADELSVSPELAKSLLDNTNT